MTNPARPPRTLTLLTWISAACCLPVVACEKRREEPPQATLPIPAPPPASAAPEVPPMPAPAPTVPARLGVALGTPNGLIAGGWSAGGLCNIEAIGTPTSTKPVLLKGGTHVTLNGWALDPKGTAAPGMVHVRFSAPKIGDYYGTATRRTPREDVNAAHPVLDKTAQSGFELDFDSDQLPAGTYSVTTILVFDDAAYICDNGRKLTRVP